MSRLLHLLPLFIFTLVTISLLIFLDDEEKQLKTALMDKNFPSFSLNTLESPEEIADLGSFEKLPALVNVWATWCVACLVEHPFLMKLNEDSVIPIYGLNYKDDREKAIFLLEKRGNPYLFSLFDPRGSLALDLGVYGAPETFYIDKNGIIKIRHVGVLNHNVWEDKFQTLLSDD